MSHDDAVGPIRYRVDDAIGVVFETWEGEITATDLRRFLAAYLADPTVLALRRTLVDLRLADIRFTGAELTEIVGSMVAPRLQGRQWKTAILVSEPVQYGVSRQWHVFAQSFSIDSVFYDMDAAMAWLLKDV